MPRKKSLRKQGKQRNSGSEGRKKVSPWFSKPNGVSRRKHLATTRAPFTKMPLSESFSQACSNSNLSAEGKAKFIKSHGEQAARGLVKITAGNVNITKARVLVNKAHFLSDLKQSTLKDIFNFTRREIITSEVKGLRSRFINHMRKYFKARKISLSTKSEKEAFDAAVSKFFSERKFEELDKPIRLAAFEKDYFGFRKSFRSSELMDAETRNSMASETFQGTRLTNNQWKAVRKWFAKHWEERMARRDKAIKEFARKRASQQEPEALAENMKRMTEKIDLIDKEFKERAKRELTQVFVKNNKTAAPPEPKRESNFKQGTRAERIASYTPREKTPVERSQEMKSEERVARSLRGVPFNAVQHALESMKSENASNARFFENLFKKKEISSGALTKLFISGTLTQKVFRAVAKDPEFMPIFGIKGLELLARGLSFIGPTGRKSVGVMRNFQGKTGKRMYEFLEKKNYINTGSGGNNVTYLSRG